MRARQVCRVPGCLEPAKPGVGACPSHVRRKGRTWQRRAARVMLAAGFRCECGAPATQVSHLDPVWAGGPELAEDERLRARCDPCAKQDDVDALRRMLAEYGHAS